MSLSIAFFENMCKLVSVELRTAYFLIYFPNISKYAVCSLHKLMASVDRKKT